ncbi:MAG: PKD-like domain-containing protein, partial [Flavobacteriales bacterium]
MNNLFLTTSLKRVLQSTFILIFLLIFKQNSNAQCSAVSVDLGRDSVYCSNQTLTLNAQVVSPSSSIPTFTWSYNGSLLSGQNSGSLSINLTDTTSGFYSVIAQVDSCIVYDTVNLSIYNIGITSNDFNTAKTQLVYCVPTGDTSGDIFLRLTLPSNISLVQSVEIDWGDGQIQIIPSSNYASPQIHNYLNGFYVFKMTVTLTNGCVSVISYPTFVGNSPSPAALQILNNQADGCFPHFTQYNFNVPSSNPDGTTYEVDWGDGSPLQTYVHPITPPVLSHTFNSSSCGNTVLGNTATYYNRFQPSVITQNPCGSFQPSASGLISVSMPPIASFSTSRSTICPGSLVDFNNTSYFGLSTGLTSKVSCDSVSPFFWRITSLTSSGSNGWSVSPPGNLGSDNGTANQRNWSPGSMAIEVLFDSSGTYKVELIVQTNCGPSIYIDTICVIKPPESSIATTDSIECSPFSFGAYSTSVLPFCDSFNVPVEYAWKVIDPSGCVDCSSSIVDSTSDSTKINLVNRSNVTQDFILELTVTPLDPITLDPLSNLSCESVSYKTVSVYPEIKIDSLTACLGELSWDLDSAVNFPSSFRWRAIPNPNVTGTTTVYQTTTIINDTLKNISDTVQFVYYEVIASSTPGSCLDTQFFSVRLLPDIIITPLVNDSICVGGTINAAYTLQYSGGNNNPTYSWKLNGISQSNNTSSFLPGNFNIVGNYLVEGTVTVGAPGCEISSTDSAIISVFDDPSIIPLLSATYCQAANPVTGLVAQASGGLGTYSYQWYSNNTNDTVGGVKLLNEIDSIYFPSLDSLGTIYYYCVVTQSGLNCMTTSSIATIQVIPQPTIDSNPIVSQEVCVGGILDSLKVSYLNGLGKVSYQWYEDTLGINSGGLLLVGDTFSSFLPQTNIVGIKYYYCEISFSLGGCTNVMSDVSKVTVRPDPIIQTNLSSQTICVGGTIDSALTANYSGGVGSPSYQWNKDGINLPNDTLSSYLPPSFNFLDTFNFGVTISLSGKGCNAVSAQIQTVNVIADPTIIVQPISAVYCQRANSPNLLLVKATGGFSNTYSYQWYSNDTNVIVGSKKIQGATDSVYLPSVDSLGIEYYYCVVSQGGLNCEDTSSIASIHVTPQASIDSNPIVSQEVCVGGGLDSLKVSHLNGLGNVSYQWYEDTTGVNSGGSLLVGDTFSSFLPETTTTGIKYYYCVIYFSSGGCDSITSDVGAVIVRQDPIITQQPLASHTICVGGTIDSALEVNYSGGVGSPSYQWQLNGTDLPSDTLNDYLPPTFVSPGTSIYRVKINLSGRGCNEMISQLVQVDVVSDPSIITQPNSDSYCQGSSPVSPLVINASGGLGVYSYQWYRDTTSNGTGVVLLNGQTDSTFVPPVTMAGTTYYYCVVTQSGLNCDDTSSRAEIIVNPEPTFFTQPIDSQLVCVGGIPDTLSVITQNGVGIPTYQWFVSRVSLSTGGDSIPGAVNSTYVPKADTVGTFYYYCRATFSMGGCSDIVSDLAVINVIPDPQIVNHPADSLSVCIGGSLSTALNVTYSGGIGLPTYFWKFNGGVIPNSDSNFYMPPSFSNLGTNQFSVSIQLSGKGCDIMNSNTSYITVITSPVMELQPISDTVCHKSVTIDTLKVRASNVVGTYNFQWYKNNSNSNFGGTLIMNATDSIYVPSTDSVGTQYYYCRISQSVSNCEVISSAAAVVVNPLPTFLTQPLDSQTVCLDGTPDLLSVTTQNGLGTPSYQWFVTRYVPNTAGDTIYNEVSSSYIPTADSIGTLYYYCVATFSQGGCSNVFSDISVVTVIPDPQISIQPLDSQFICVGGSINPPFQVGYTGGLGKPTYQWKVNGGNIQNTDSSVYLPPTFVNPDTNLFGVTITLSGSGCDVMNSDSAYVIVVPDPVVAIDPLSDTYCLSTGSVNELLV